MVRDADLVEEAVQLAYYCVDLLGEVAGVHGGGDSPLNRRRGRREHSVAHVDSPGAPLRELRVVMLCGAELSSGEKIGCGGVYH